MNWLKTTLRKWLGIEAYEKTSERLLLDLSMRITNLDELLTAQLTIGVDTNFHDQSLIIVVSRLKDGQIRLIPVRFQNLRELEDFVSGIRQEFGPKSDVLYDLPFGMRRHQR